MAIQMRHINPAGTRVFMGQFLREEIHPALTRIMTEQNIRAGSVQLMGTMTDVEFRAYDFTTKTRRAPIMFSGALEIVNAQGHLSMNDGQPHVHLHASVTVPHSGIWVAGGHVQRAVAFAVEFTLWAYDGDELVRRFDHDVGLSIWDVPEL